MGKISKAVRGVADIYNGASLIVRIIVGLIIGTVLFLYLFTTFLAAVVAVLTSRLFPQTLSLGKAAKADVVPQGLSEVIQTLLTNIVANPIQAIIDGNYICILMWA